MLRACRVALALIVFAAVHPAMAADGPHVAPMKALAEGKIAQWVAAPELVDAIKAQNAKHAALTEADIGKLDKTWRAETQASARPMIDGVLNNPVSAYLKGVQEKSGGLYTEIFVMDARGLNVGQSAITSDYWQGDEEKWQGTFGKGAGAVVIGDVEQDESTQRFQSQVSMTVTDPATGEVIGAVTVGVDVDTLLQ